MSVELCSRPGESKIALVWLIGTSTWVRTLVCMQKLGGSGGMLPQENHFQNLMLWDGFWGFFGQNTTANFCFSPILVTGFWFTSRLHGHSTHGHGTHGHGDKCNYSAHWSPPSQRPGSNRTFCAVTCSPELFCPRQCVCWNNSKLSLELLT